jgi:hypothetical protein
MTAPDIPPTRWRDVLTAISGRAGAERRAVTTRLHQAASSLSTRRVQAITASDLGRCLDGLEEAVADVRDACTDLEKTVGAAAIGQFEPDLETRLQTVRRALQGWSLKEGAQAETSPDVAVTAAASATAPSGVGEALMSLVDQVDAALLAGDEPHPFLVRLRVKLVDALQQAGVTMIDDRGAVDDTRHEVVDVLVTADPSLHETIGSTVRPGYAVGETVLRSQQVVMWRAAEHTGQRR